MTLMQGPRALKLETLFYAEIFSQGHTTLVPETISRILSPTVSLVDAIIGTVKKDFEPGIDDKTPQLKDIPPAENQTQDRRLYNGDEDGIRSNNH